LRLQGRFLGHFGPKPRLQINGSLSSIPQPPQSPSRALMQSVLALKNNPRITASHLLALAAGQVTRETPLG